MLERSDVEFPLWRKKVDKGFLRQAVTPIPKWLLKSWGIEARFRNVSSRSQTESKVQITFHGDRYIGHVVRSANGRFRLFYDPDLMPRLRETYLMSYMRALEGDLRKVSNVAGDVEREIPFWEFIDIEFDASSQTFHFTPHYYHPPQFPELFRRLVSSPRLRVVDDEISGKEHDRIHKQSWRPRNEYKTEIGANNVIYTLIDTKRLLIYIGEASKMIRRFDAGHTEIPDWNHYKYNVLPKALERHRVTLERMAIRDLAALIENRQGIETQSISSYRLANRKIDK